MTLFYFSVSQIKRSSGQRTITHATFRAEEKLPWGADERDARCVQLKEELFCHIEGICLAGCTHFICGMARGCDFYFA